MSSQAREKGFLMIEVLVIVTIVAIMGLALCRSLVVSIQTNAQTIHDSVAAQVVLERIEQLAGIDPSTLTAANNTTSNVTRQGITFSRSETITVNADGSRSISVSANDRNVRLGGITAMSSTFALWGSN